MKKLLLFLIILSIASFAKAQLYFRNNTTEPVVVGFAAPSTDKNFRGWTSYGWYKCEPRERIQLMNTTIGMDYIYYFAFSNTKEYKGDQNFVVHPSQAFQIKNADMEYQLKPGLEMHPFRKYILPTIRMGHTIELNY